MDVVSGLRQIKLINAVNNFSDISAKTNCTNLSQIKAIAIDYLLGETGLTHLPGAAVEWKTETHQNSYDSFSESEEQDCGINWAIFHQNLTKNQWNLLKMN